MKSILHRVLLFCLCVSVIASCRDDSAKPEALPAASARGAPAFPAGLSADKADLALGGMIAGGTRVYLDLAPIKAFPSESFRSLDPWDKKEHEFMGTRLEAVLAAAGIEAGAESLIVKARNGYGTAIKRKDYEAAGYILAWAMDGADLSDTDASKKRAPLAIAIDFAANPGLDPEIYKHQLVWQVSEITAQ